MSAGESVGEFIDDPASADLEDAANVLVLAPPLADGVRKAYYERLLPVDPAARNVLAVQYSRTASRFLEEWDRHLGAPPRRFGIVDVGEATSAAGGADVDRGAVALVESPSDLTGIGMKVGSYLDSHGDGDTVVSFDSLTVLLQYVDLERAFRFLNAIASQVREVGALAHYHVDPNAHDDRVLATLASLFDGVARFDDGTWETRRR